MVVIYGILIESAAVALRASHDGGKGTMIIACRMVTAGIYGGPAGPVRERSKRCGDEGTQGGST
jgi:hypothetical protein